MKILFITSDSDLLNYANLFLLNDTTLVDIEFCKSVSSAISQLEINQDYTIVYLGHRLQKDQKLSELSSVLIPLINEGKVKFIGTNKAFKDRDWATYFNELHLPKKILFHIYNYLKLQKNKDYIEVKIDSLMNFSTFPFSCYHEVVKEDKKSYLKLFNRGDDITFEDVNKYISKGLTTFYIQTSDVQKSIDSYQEKVKSDIDIEDIEKVKELAIDYAVEILDESGLQIKDEHKDISRKAFEHTQDLIDTSKNNKGKFLELINKTDTFYFKHITMTSLVCCFVLDELMLTDPVLKEKLCLASNFQNIFLENELELKISEKSQIEKLERQNRKRVLAHAHLASNLLEKHDRIDLDVLKIVREHHGDKLGQSFPEAISSTSKLSLIFQLASLFAQKYLIAQQAYDGVVDTFKILNDVVDKLESRDKSLIKSLKEVAISVSSK